MENKEFKDHIKSLATPLTSIIFLVVAISGINVFSSIR